jgi:hypothetical protein
MSKDSATVGVPSDVGKRNCSRILALVSVIKGPPWREIFDLLFFSPSNNFSYQLNGCIKRANICEDLDTAVKKICDFNSRKSSRIRSYIQKVFKPEKPEV